MEYQEFKDILISNLNEVNQDEIKIEDNKAKKMYTYMNLLIEWNKKINLTAIKEPKDIIIKHFVDSLTICKYINKNDRIIDIGTGAGFPGIPLSIALEEKDLNITLLDSLNKRIMFLEKVIEEDNIKGIELVHGRAEDYGQNIKYREEYDIAVSRAVAPLNILLEYMLPFVKIGGFAICMKGPKIDDEMNNIDKVLDKLGGQKLNIEHFKLNNDNERNIMIIKKIKHTKKEYPRKAGTPAKEPIY